MINEQHNYTQLVTYQRQDMTHVLKPKKDVNKLTHTILKAQRDSRRSPSGSSLPSVLNSRFTSEYSQSLCGALQCSSVLCGAPDSGAEAHAACWWHPNLQRWYWECENSSHTTWLLLGTPTPLHLPSHGLSIGPFNNSIISNNHSNVNACAGSVYSLS